jgi:hypothetical protein
LHALRSSAQFNIRNIPNTFVYKNPTILALATFLSAFATADNAPSADPAKIIAEMQRFVKKYTSDLPRHTPVLPVPTKEIVVLTGSTGRLGSMMLALLVQSANVTRVYALNRKGIDEARLRQRWALMESGLDTSIVDSGKIVYGEINFERTDLGFEPGLVEEVRNWFEERSNLTHLVTL